MNTVGGSRRSAMVVSAGVATGLVLVFLYAPLVVSVAYSFNAGVEGRQTARFTGFTLGAYRAALQDDSIRASLTSGMAVGLCVMVDASLLGSALGLALVRHPATLVRRVLSALVTALLIVPEVVLAVSFLQLITDVHVALGFVPMVVALTPMAIALVAFLVRGSVLTLPASIEDAARDLGASEPRVLRSVVLPQLLPAVVVGATLSFTLAFDNLVIATFLSTPDVSTLAVYLYSSLNYGTTPTVYAATTGVLAITLVLLALAGGLYVLLGRRRRAA